MEHAVGARESGRQRVRIAGDVDFAQRETALGPRRGQVDRSSGREVIDHHDFMAGRQQRIREVTADKAGTAGDDVTSHKASICGEAGGSLGPLQEGPLFRCAHCRDVVSFLAGNCAFFCEEVALDTATQFDAELDEAVSVRSLERATLTGYCNLANQPTTFAVTDPNLRENVIAAVSGSGARHRIVACGLSLALFESPLVSLSATAEVINARRMRILLTETTTPFHHAFKALISPELLTTSEYFGPEYRSGDTVGGVRHEDLQSLSFANDSLELLITSDVMEHVPDALAAEREIVRVLRPGGIYCFTVPLHAYAEADLVLANAQPDGSITYFADPIYHGDPLRPEGVLVFRIFSIKEMTARFAALGAECKTYRLWSKHYGILGQGCWVHVVRKL